VPVAAVLTRKKIFNSVFDRMERRTWIDLWRQ